MIRVNWYWIGFAISLAFLAPLSLSASSSNFSCQVAEMPSATQDKAASNADETSKTEAAKDESESAAKPDEAASVDGKSDTPAVKKPTTRRPTFDKQSSEILESLKPICQTVNQVTVQISARGRAVALGTIVDGNGFVLTKASELKNGLMCKLADGRSFSAQVFGIHQKTDLALLKIDAAELPVVEWSSNVSLAVGYWVVTPKATDSPLLGIVSVQPRTIAPPVGYIGIQMLPHADGVRIDLVLANSPAEKAGLRVNDIIVGLNGQPVTEQDSLREAIQKNPVGTEINLKVLRAGQPMEFQIQLADRKDFGSSDERGDVQNEMGGRLSKRRLDFPMAIQHDTPLSPNECGGPIIDLTGKVVGINIARSGRVDSLALPAATVLAVLESLKSGQLSPTVIHKSEIEKIQTRLSAITTEMEQLPKHKVELSDQVNRDSARLEELRRVMDDVQARLTELETQHAQSESQLKAANSGNSRLQKEKERLEAQLQALISGTN